MGPGLMKRADADRRARRLLRWYPKAWRLRYGEEFTQLLIDDISERPRSWHRTLDVARSGLTTRRQWRNRADQRSVARFSVIAGAASIAAGFGVLGLADAWHRWEVLSAHCVYPTPRPSHGDAHWAPGYTCLPIVGAGHASPSIYVGVGLGCAVVGACLFVLARRIRRACAALHGGFVWPLPRVRLSAVVLIVAATLAGAAVLHGLQDSPPVCPRGFTCFGGPRVCPPGFTCLPPSPLLYARHPWADSALLAICLLGLAGVAAALLTPRRLAAAVLLLGAALAGAAVLRGHQIPPWPGNAGFAYQPYWVYPATLGVSVLGIAGAAAVVMTARRRKS
jgi:hypothetical protein